jgi:hypothetical protein
MAEEIRAKKRAEERPQNSMPDATANTMGTV